MMYSLYDDGEKITLIPRGRAQGLTWFTPNEQPIVNCCTVGRKPKMKDGSVGFSGFPDKTGRFRSVSKTEPKKYETETEHMYLFRSVSRSVPL